MLSAEEMFEIKITFLENKIKITEVAKKFKVSRQYYSGVVNRRIENKRLERLTLDYVRGLNNENKT